MRAVSSSPPSKPNENLDPEVTSQTLTTGLAGLDSALGVKLAPGNLILGCGQTGSGKTTLAAQLAVSFAKNKYHTMFITNEAPVGELTKRILSAQCDIPYDKIKDCDPYLNKRAACGIDPNRFGADATRRAADLHNRIEKYLRIFALSQWSAEPGINLTEWVEEYTKNTGHGPDVIIFDYLSPRGFSEEIRADEFKCRDAVYEIAVALKACAEGQQALVVAFAQADVCTVGTKSVTHQAICEYKRLAEMFDAFVGISAMYRPVDEEIGAIYDDDQFLTVITGKGEPPVLVPVRREFGFQRFASRMHIEQQSPEDHDIKLKARLVKETTEFAGYVLANRRRFQELFTCTYPLAVNVYAYLLLVANLNRALLGRSWHSRKTICKALGITEKRLRTASEELEHLEFIRIFSHHRGSNEYEILEWEKEQNPLSPGYFKLFRNLRDADRADITSNPIVFAVWLWLLCHARAVADEDLNLVPGETLLKRRLICENLQIEEDQLTSALEVLLARGSIIHSGASMSKVAIVNWALYQIHVYPRQNAAPKERKANGGQLADK